VKSGMDRTLTAVSVLAGLALVGAFVAGLLGGAERGTGADGDSAPEVEAGGAAGSAPATPPLGGGEERAGAIERRAAGEVRTQPLADAAPFEGAAKVEVLNGAGRAGFARDATTRLRDLGHDVVFYGNAGRFDYASSVVLDRGGPPGAARAVAEALGIDEVRVERDPDLALDATVILGAGWELPPPPPEPAGGVLGFLRRLLGRD